MITFRSYHRNPSFLGGPFGLATTFSFLVLYEKNVILKTIIEVSKTPNAF